MGFSHLKLSKKFAIIFLSLLPLNSNAGVHFTLTGTLSDHSYGLLSQASHAASGSVAFDIGDYLRLGVTHRQSKSQAKGYYETFRGSNSYYYQTVNTHEVANSFDVTIILYYGRIFVPYIQIGMVDKTYFVTQETETTITSQVNKTPVPVPNGGFGLGIRLNRSFSLKLTQSFSTSVKQESPLLKAESSLDSYLTLGISYNI